jgi:hypothetical protein
LKTDKKVAKAMKQEMEAKVTELTEELNKTLAQMQQAQQVVENLRVRGLELQGAIKCFQSMVAEPEETADPA